MSQAQIAVVDDSPFICELMKEVLAPLGHHVTTFAEGTELLEGLEHFSLVVTDVQMPGLDGIALCERIRDTFTKAQLPIIVISVLGGDDDILRGFEAGANDYVCKPFSHEAFRKKVTLYLQDETKGGLLVETRRWSLLESLGVQGGFPVVFDRYVLEGTLGKGASGVVYSAKRRHDGQEVAVKILSREVTRDRESLSRYFREIDSLALLDCPNIVRFVAAGYEIGHYFVVMEKVGGETALSRKTRNGRLDIPLVLEIGESVSAALVALAGHGLVHRDVKPANIMLADDCVKLVDLGLAKKLVGPSVTPKGEALGTLLFMAPEVLTGDPASIGSDLYALGITIFELLVGRNPMRSRSARDLLGDQELPRLPMGPEGYSESLSTVVGLLMHPNPKKRLVDPLVAYGCFQRLRAELHLGSKGD